MATSDKQNSNIISQRIIAHLDMDAFFAAVEERDKPRLKGRPIAVGSDPMEGRGRGVVSTANYKAREYGIRSGLPISKAWQFSEQAREAGKPEVVFLPVDFHKYQQVSAEIMEIIRKYSTVTEQSSIDEMYLDLSSLDLDFKRAAEICRQLKQEIREKEKLTASIGLGPNKLIAKIASDMQKPDGLTIILPAEVEEFLFPLPIRKIPGVGPKTEQYLNGMGVQRVGDLKKYAKSELHMQLGKWGGALYEKIRGVDDAPVTEEYETKSIGEQETFPKDNLEFNFVFARIDELCTGVFRRFQRSEFKSFRTVVISVRFSDFATKNRSHTLPEAVHTLKTLKSEVLKLMMPFFDRRENPKKKLIRLIGVRMEKLG